MTPTQLRVEDFGDLPDELVPAFQRLFRQLNPALEGFTSALTSRFSGKGAFVTLALQTGTAVTPGVAPFKSLFLQKPFDGRVRGVLCVGGRNRTNTSAVFEAVPFPTWEDTGDGRLKLLWVTGLSASTKYELTFLVLGE